jgi:hypothetical protein
MLNIRKIHMNDHLMGRTGVYVCEISLATLTFGGSDSPIWGLVGGVPLQDSTQPGRTTW